MLYKIRRHTNAVIFDGKNIVSISVPESSLLHNPERNSPASRRIFYRIAQQINKYLV